jgi:hypothetical protein
MGVCRCPSESSNWRPESGNSAGLGVEPFFQTPHFGAHTECDLPNKFLDLSSALSRCLPQRKHDMVEAPRLADPANGDPETLAL